MALKNCDPLEVEAAKCSKCTDLLGAGVNTPAGAAAPGDERVEAYMLCNVSLGLARLHFERGHPYTLFFLKIGPMFPVFPKKGPIASVVPERVH